MAESSWERTWTRPAVRRVRGKELPPPERSFHVQSYVPEWMKGTAITMRHFLQNTKELVLGQKKDPVLGALEGGIITLKYPDERRPYPERYRGLHRLTVRPDGSARCVACLCCSTACPAQCIHVAPAEYCADDPRAGYERYAAAFVIDELRCVFCGLCVEACPCDALRMDSGRHPAAYDSRGQLILERDLLAQLPARDGTRRSTNTRLEAGDARYPGLTREQGH
ncbi:MAG: NADH-quinone oxidoreductase subunit I [Deltaproteobacteria bacterium]|nr:NADH-quinone oxidoreductase subunit I [Deltaproteobacteria bacterium]